MDAAIEPHQHVRIVLSEARKRGLKFSEAWTIALRSLPRNHPEIELWREALVWARWGFERAYLLAPGPDDYAPIIRSDSDAGEALDEQLVA